MDTYYVVKFSFENENSRANEMEFLDLDRANLEFEKMSKVCRKVSLTKIQKIREFQQTYDSGLVLNY